VRAIGMGHVGWVDAGWVTAGLETAAGAERLVDGLGVGAKVAAGLCAALAAAGCAAKLNLALTAEGRGAVSCSKMQAAGGIGGRSRRAGLRKQDSCKHVGLIGRKEGEKEGRGRKQGRKEREEGGLGSSMLQEKGALE
jgi:hypothetical protein